MFSAAIIGNLGCHVKRTIRPVRTCSNSACNIASVCI